MRSKLIITILFLLLFCRIYPAEITFNIYYPVNKFEVSLYEKDRIKHYLDSLTPYNISKISIVGHTDLTADSLYNIKLSARRTNAVSAYLEELGFNKMLINTNYHGKNKPVALDNSEEAKQRNRRSEITIHYTDSSRFSKKNTCNLPEKVIISQYGKQIVFEGCEYESLKNCIEIFDRPSYNEIKKGIVVFHNKGCKLPNFGKLEINLLDGCSPNECFKTPLKVRFPIKGDFQGCTSWALFNGNRMPLTVVEINNRYYLELMLPCPTSWINCNCKKNQKH